MTKVSTEEIRLLEERIIDVIRTVYDPEIPVDIYELGLIYEVKVDEKLHADVLMTLTSPSCPVAESLPLEVEEKVRGVNGIETAKVELTFDPPWDKDMMSEAALLETWFHVNPYNLLCGKAIPPF